MDKRFLEECLAKGMSLEAIGRLTGRPSGTVSYWVHKYELAPPSGEKYLPRGGLRRDQLAPLVDQQLTLAEIAEAVNRSISTVRYWLKKHGLRAAGGRRRTRVTKGPRIATFKCQQHGEVEFVLEKRGYYRCKRCRATAVAERRRVVKQILVDEAGGACALCGYNRCSAALQFRHLDPRLKKFHLAQRGLSRSLERSRNEARKCVLLCANCHAEVEGGFRECAGRVASGTNEAPSRE
jgi:transposase